MAGYANFEVKRNKQTKAVGLYDKSAKNNKSNEKLTKSEKLMQGVEIWAAFYRARPDIFVEEYFGITLKPFQKILLYVMIHYNYTMFFASRGLGKSWLVALYCLVRCTLFPGSKIILAAKTKEQAMNIVSEKIPELIAMSTTGMIEREIDGSIKTSLNTVEPNVVFLNGSWIKVVPATQTARSKRANLLVVDEFRMIDPDIYRNVLRRFLAVSRQPKYLKKPEYKNNKIYTERNQEIFLSSAYYKFNWSFSRYSVFVRSMLQGKGYFVCGLPYQFAIKEGLSNEEQLMDELSEEDIDEIGWLMEMDCLFFGESEKAYYKTEELKNIKTISFPIYKKNLNIIIKNKDIQFKKKTENEIRVLSCDIALLGGDSNDASVFSLIIAEKRANGKTFKRYVKNIETCQGLHPETQALIIRRLFEDYDCDFIVLDRQGNGISVYGYLCRKLYDNERKKEYMPFYSMNEKDEPKLSAFHTEDEYEERIYTISATEEFNHDMALDLKDKIVRNKIQLLISPEDAKQILNQESSYNKLSPEEKADLLNPYIQTLLLENEMVLLERLEHPKFIKLKEQSGKRKDRYSSIAYGNRFISFLEEKLIQHNDYDEDDDIIYY